MKKVNLIIVVFFMTIILVACKKDKDCDNEIEQQSNWTTEQFKSNYTIQFPSNYSGGITGFEGNIFNKDRDDDKISFSYNFCGPFYCDEFGDTLNTPFPPSATYWGYSFGQPTAYVLNNRIEIVNSYCETVGVLFYMHDESQQNYALYYMKTNGLFLRGLEVSYESNTLSEMISVVKTIKEME